MHGARAVPREQGRCLVSRGLVRRWRRSAREWAAVAEHFFTRERQTVAPVSLEVVRAEAYTRILNECAASLERSLAIAARKAKGRCGVSPPTVKKVIDEAIAEGTEER